MLLVLRALLMERCATTPAKVTHSWEVASLVFWGDLKFEVCKASQHCCKIFNKLHPLANQQLLVQFGSNPTTMHEPLLLEFFIFENVSIC